MRSAGTSILCAALFCTCPGTPSSAYTLVVLHTFDSTNRFADGFWPQNQAYFDRTTGALFGTTTAGGDAGASGCYGQGCGTAFALWPGHNGRPTGYQVLHTFEYTGKDGISDGDLPDNLVSDPSGNIYGTTRQGGDANCEYGMGCGTVYMLVAPLSGRTPKERVLHVFEGTEGGNPYAGVTIDHRTNVLYGTACTGGSNDNGVVFSLTPNADRTNWAYAVLHSFGAAPDGKCPAAPLTPDSSGNLYGTTQYGGRSDAGTAFELSPKAGRWTERILYAFKRSDDTPTVGLAFNRAGDLVGTTDGPEGGTAFALAPGAGRWSATTLYRFRRFDGVSALSDRLLVDDADDVLGVTVGNGRHTEWTGGNLFRIRKDGDVYRYRKVYHFCSLADCRDGANPTGVSTDANGNLYGTTLYGGNANRGVVFMLVPQEPDLHRRARALGP